MQLTNELNDILKGHTVAEHTRNQLGVVPILLVEFFRESLNRRFIPALVLKLEVVALGAVGVLVFDNNTRGHMLGQHDTLFIVHQTRKDFIGMTVEKTYECHPLFLLILEAHHITFQFHRADFRYLRRLTHGRFFLFLILFFCAHKHATTAAVAVNGTSLTTALPSFNVKSVHQLFIHIRGEVYGHGDAVVYPLLNGALHLHFHEPINIVCRCLVVRRLRHESVNLFLRVILRSIKTIHLHPSHKLGVINDVFFKRIARFIHKVYAHFGVVRIDLTTALINGEEDGFDTARCLRHQTCCTRWRNGQASDVATAVLHHIFIERRVGILYAEHKGICHFALGVVDLEGTAFARHFYRRSIRRQSKCALNGYSKVCRLLSAIAKSERSNHIALSRDTHTRTATFDCLLVNLLPKLLFRVLHFFRLWVALHLIENLFNHLKFKVDDVVHQALSEAHVLLKEVEVEACFGRKRMFYIPVKVDGEKATTVVGTKGNFATRVCRDGAETEVSIAVGNAFADNRVPEKHTRFGTAPSVVHNLAPQGRSINAL